MKAGKQAISAVVALWLLLFQCSIAGPDVDHALDNTLSFSNKQCLTVTKQVLESRQHNEDSIAAVCAEKMEYTKCDFFAEALSLASTHTDFDPQHFCFNMEEAHFCSETMDQLLVSQPVADLAYGECLRAKPPRDGAYCRKFRTMLAVAVQNEDLDTMRACYMIEAYSNSTSTEALSTSKELDSNSSKMRIIASSGGELSDLGYGNSTSLSAVGNPGIVLQPKHLDYFGNGTGHPLPREASTIIVAPKPANGQIQMMLASASEPHSRLVPESASHAGHPMSESSTATSKHHPNLGTAGSALQQPPSIYKRTSGVRANFSVPNDHSVSGAQPPLSVPTAMRAMTATEHHLVQPHADATPQPPHMPGGHEVSGILEPVVLPASYTPVGPNPILKPVVLGNESLSKSGSTLQRAVSPHEHTRQIDDSHVLPGSQSSLRVENDQNGTDVQVGQPLANQTKENGQLSASTITSPREAEVHSKVVNRTMPMLHVAKTGLTQEGLGTVTSVGKSKEKGWKKGKADSKRDGKGEYNGFLSKFVQ